MSVYLENDIIRSAEGILALYSALFEEQSLSGMLEALSGLPPAGRAAVSGDGFGETAARFAFEAYRETSQGNRLTFAPRSQLLTAPETPDSVILFCLEEGDEAVRTILEASRRTGIHTAVFSAHGSWRPFADSFVQLPEGGGVTGSYAALLAAAALCALARCAAEGSVSRAQAGSIAASVREYLDSVDMPALMAGSAGAALSVRSAGIRCLDLVGEGPVLAALDFCRLLAVREHGTVCMTENTEDWHHINFFERSAPEILTVFICNGSSPSFTRCEETVRIAAAIGRPLAVITDLEDHEFPGGSTVRTPPPKAAPGWAEPLIQFLPAALIALEGSAAAK